ncbi:Hydrogenase maturation factor HoxQ [Rhodovulum sp. P5]|nr:Hydrogenase maturation factor HoxQ [Rhodovulum sp. P5]
MVLSLLAELARHLDHLALTGEPAAIDLRSLPITPQGRERLEATLGRGEVTATIQSGGRSEVAETAYPGLWWVRHLGAGDRLLTERLEIATVPEALAAAPADIAAASARLAATLNALSEGEETHVTS